MKYKAGDTVRLITRLVHPNWQGAEGVIFAVVASSWHSDKDVLQITFPFGLYHFYSTDVEPCDGEE